MLLMKLHCPDLDVVLSRSVRIVGPLLIMD